MRTKLLFILIIIFCSCGRKTNDPGSIKVIDMLSSPESEITYLSDITSDVEYIPLQTSENSLINYINDIKICDNKIYIPVNKEMLCFDKTGRYLYKLSKVGRGPSEYTSIYIYFIDINSDGDLLILLTFGKLLVYKISGNEFGFHKSLNFIANIKNVPSNLNFMPGQNNVLISYSPSGGELFRNVLINIDGDTLVTRPNYYHYKENEKYGFAGAYTNIHFKYNNMLHFKELFSDTVFILDQSNNIRPYLVLDCHGKQVTPDILANLSPGNGSVLKVS